jgi:nucleotide-binding universal stress UspA family protein
MRVRPACRQVPSGTYAPAHRRETLPIVRRRPGFNRILFAVNGSEHSAATVEVVAAIAGTSQSDVLVLHVWNPADVPLAHDDDVSRRRNDETNVSAVVERLRGVGISASGESHGATSDSVAAFITSRADSFDADLIALGNRGLSELHSFLNGSRTQQVMAEASRPVLAVRNVKPHRASRIGRVVLALDGSGDYDCMVQACIDVAQPASAEVEVTNFGVRNERRLLAVADRLAKHGVTAILRSARDRNHAADQILSAVLHPRADLLIIGAPHARAGALVAARVMNRVLQSCPCPLLVAPARDLVKTRCSLLATNRARVR